MVEKMHLPPEVIDGTSAVGPFFWWTYAEDTSNTGNGHIRECYFMLYPQISSTYLRYLAT